MWLVVGGPLTVVVAAIVTAVIAVSGADEVLDTTSGRRAASPGSADAPAVSARNHAVTPRTP